MGRAKIPATALALLAATLLGACSTGDEREIPPRIDSAKRFSGERQVIAQVVERYEAAVRARDYARLCRDVLPAGASKGERFRRQRLPRCESEISRGAMLAPHWTKGRDTYDLVGQRIRFREQVAPENWMGDRLARVSVSVRTARRDRVEDLTLVRTRLGWRVTARTLDPRCKSSSYVIVSSSFFGVSEARAPRRALLTDSPWSRRVNRSLERGGSLVLVSVSFDASRPRSDFELRDRAGKPLASFDVERLGAHYDPTSFSRCEGAGGAGRFWPHPL